MQEPITELLPFSSLFLAVLIHFVWQATLIVALVAIVRSLIHPRFFRARYLLSVLGLFAVLISPLVTTGFYISSEEAMMSIQPPVASVGSSPAVKAQTATFTSLLETQFQVVFNWFDNHRLFWLGCWLSGFLILLLRLCASLGHCFRLRRRQKPLPPHLLELAERIKQKLNLTRNVIVASSQEITQAVATGIIKPVVLVPAAWVTQLPAASIEAVLAHELAHLKRWDLWINLLQRFAETVFFFHPMVWWLSQQISSEREVCCDHLAISVTGQPMQYVETLAQVADTITFNELEFQFGTAFIGGKNMNLLRRAKMILEPASIDAQSPFRTLALIACTGLLISYGSYAYCATPAAALATVQDRDQDHDHARDDDHNHNIIVRRNKINREQDGNVEVVVIGDDSEHGGSQENLHGHLVELLHGQESGNVDTRELARQLRRLADRLESESRPKETEHKVRRRVEEFGFDVKRVDPKNHVIEVEVDRSKNVFLHKMDEPKRKIVQLKKDEYRNVHSPEKMHDRMTFEGKKNAPEQNRFIYRVENQKGKPHEAHDDREVHDVHGVYEIHERNAAHDLNEAHEHELQFGLATTSDGELGQVLRELKNEVQQLRREVNQLRSGRDLPKDYPMRLRVQDRKVQPDRKSEPRRVEREFRFEPGSERRMNPKENPDSNRSKDGVWIESKSKSGNVWWSSKSKPKDIWIEKQPKADVDGRVMNIKPRLNKRDGNLTLDVDVKSESADIQSKRKATWTVDLEVTDRPKSESRRTTRKASTKTKTSESGAVWLFEHAEDENVKKGEEAKSSKNKKKK